MSIDKKKLLYIGLPCVFVVFVLILFLVAFAPKLKNRTVVAFYNLTPSQTEAVTAVLSEAVSAKGKPIDYSFVTLDSSLPLEEQITKKTDLVITNYGVSALKAAGAVPAKKAAKIDVDDDILTGCTLSVYQKAHFNEDSKKLDIIPILLDYYTIDNRGSNGNTVWSRMVFAGGEDKVLLDTVGCFTEACGGKELYDNLISYIEENRSNISMLSTEECPANAACTVLGNYIKDKNMASEVLRMKMQDIIIYMEANLTDTVFTSLSAHRTVPYETIMKFTSQDHYPSFMDSDAALDTRYFCAPVICAVPLSTEKDMHTALESLYTPAAQESLCYKTGLAPVLANCNVPDLQSDDARYWIAASNAPLTPLSDYFYTDEERAAAATALRSAISVVAGSIN